MSYEVQVVRSARDFERVRELRRAAFELELGYDAYADLDESIDEHSTVLLWTRHGRAAGTVRLSVRSDGPLEDESELELETWRSRGGFTDAEIGQCSRLVVTPELRARGLVSHISARVYAEAARRGLALIFIDATAPLLSYYRRFGFRHFRQPYTHPILAMQIHPLVLFLGDAEHFERVGSRLRELVPVDTAARARMIYQRQFETRAGAAGVT